MHVVMISGSRNPEGRTAGCANAIAKGLAKATSELFLLPTMKLERCRQCNADGWGICRTEFRCVIEDDDFAGTVEKLKAADAAVFLSPVYLRDLSESIRGFLDRLRRITFRQNTRVFQGKPAVVLAMAGGGGGGTPTTSLNLETMVGMCGYDIVDVINVRRQNFDIKVPMLEMTGAWLATKPTSGPMPPMPPR